MFFWFIYTLPFWNFRHRLVRCYWYDRGRTANKVMVDQTRLHQLYPIVPFLHATLLRVHSAYRAIRKGFFRTSVLKHCQVLGGICPKLWSRTVRGTQGVSSMRWEDEGKMSWENSFFSCMKTQIQPPMWANVETNWVKLDWIQYL